MAHPHQVHIGHLSARARVADAAARTTLENADLHPTGLPPSAILCVRRLRAGSPLRTMGDLKRPDATWEREVQGRLDAMAVTAARPERGNLPFDADAVLFADESELLACLAVSLETGRRSREWWWQEIPRERGWPVATAAEPGRAAGPMGVLIPVWVREAHAIPAAMARLMSWGRAEWVIGTLDERQAALLAAAVQQAFGESPTPTPEAPPGPRQVPVPGGSEAPSAAHVGYPQKSTTSDLGYEPLGEDRRVPATPSGPAATTFMRMIRRLRGDASNHLAQDSRTPRHASPPAFEETRSRGIADSSPLKARLEHPDGADKPVRADQAGKADGADGADATAPLPVVESPGTDRSPVPDPMCRKDARAPSESASPPGEDEHPVPTRGPAPDTCPPADDPRSAKSRYPSSAVANRQTLAKEGAADGSQQKAHPAKSGKAGRPGYSEPPPTRPEPATPVIEGPDQAPVHAGARDPWTEHAAEVETRLGGVFYLVNVLRDANRLRSMQDAGCTPWGALDLSARSLAATWCDADAGDDPVWRALALLDGREPLDLPPLLPASWTRGQCPHWLPSVPTGLELPYLKAHGLPAGAAPVLARLAASLGGTIRRRMRIGDDAAAVRTLLYLPARVWISATHVDVAMPLDTASLEIRISGYDQDPGWVADLRRVVQYFYQ